MGPDIQVGRWTPLVTLPIGTSSVASCGHSGRQISRDTSPCLAATPFTRLESRMAVAVIWKVACPSSGCDPIAPSCSGVMPISSWIDPAQASTWSSPKRSCPAGTGVWVVKMLRRRTSSTASA
ncbi:MAG: hypothetical protein IPK12_11995 [Gemmatimonadetes bacterium]|nr:hypothetical protein [Gemmatimonadota bacterium]